MSEPQAQKPKRIDKVRFCTALMLLAVFACIVWIASVGLPAAGMDSPWIRIPLLVGVSTAIVLAPFSALFAGVWAGLGQYLLARAFAHYYLLFASLAKCIVPSDLGMSRLAENMLAVSYVFQGRFYDARALLMRSLAAEDDTITDSDFVYSLLAHVNVCLGLSKEAIDCLEKARRHCEKTADVLPEDVYYCAIAEFYSNAGAHLADLDRLDEAIDLLKKARQYRTQYCGEESHEVAKTLNNLGYAYFKAGNFKASREILERAKEIAEKTRSAGESFFGNILNNLGMTLHALADDGEAETLLLKATQLPSDGPAEVGFRTCALGHFYSDRREYGKAVRYYSRAIKCWSRLQGYRHPEYLLCVERYRDSLLALKKTEQAKQVAKALQLLRDGKLVSPQAIPLVS